MPNERKETVEITIKRKLNAGTILILAIAGYLIAMFLHYVWRRGRHKVTFGALAAAVFSRNEKYKTVFGGMALYEAGARAGLTFVQEGKPLDGLGNIQVPIDEATIEYKGKIFECRFSERIPLYEQNEAGEYKQQLNTILRNTYKDTGLYFIWDDGGELVYIGMAGSKAYGFHRTLRHFAQNSHTYSGAILNHDTYPRGAGYEVMIVQCNNQTRERLELLEEYFLRKHRPRDAWTEDEEQKLERELTDEAAYRLLEETAQDGHPQDLFREEDANGIELNEHGYPADWD